MALHGVRKENLV